MIRVIVVDDHPIVRSGIVSMLASEADFEVVGQASDGVEAVALVNELVPDVVLMDLQMPRKTGDQATAEILAAHPDVRIVILTTYDSDPSILAAIEAGARGYMLKAAPQNELLAGIRSVARGEVVLAPAIAALMVQRAQAPTLTGRELDVLRLVADGNSNPKIAELLHLGSDTVKTHLQHAFEKLGVSDRTRAVTRAMELGLL